MKTIDSLIDFLDRIATPPITETKIEIIENKLFNWQLRAIGKLLDSMLICISAA